jgi:SAM-dependent methyltransferase
LRREEVSAKRAYDNCSPIYDEWNGENDYELWLGDVLMPELAKFGLPTGGWALDVGCGTGRAFEPLLGRGWNVVGCDVSTGMLGAAERKFGSRVRLLNLDARSLPAIAPEPGASSSEAFQLVLLLNDVINYVIDDDDLVKVFSGVRRNLSRDSGLVVFDTNTLRQFRDEYESGDATADGGWVWQGLAENVVAGGTYEASLSGPRIETHLHRQRHWLPTEIAAAMEAAGLSVLAVIGQREDGGRVLLSNVPDELRDAKFVFVGAASL